eukprot:7383033-Prymnesium_polylepis.1
MALAGIANASHGPRTVRWRGTDHSTPNAQALGAHRVTCAGIRTHTHGPLYVVFGLGAWGGLASGAARLGQTQIPPNFKRNMPRRLVLGLQLHQTP